MLSTINGGKAPKRIISMLSQLSISTSHPTLLAQVRDTAKAASSTIKRVAAKGNAFQVSFDNVNFLRHVRDQRILNHGSMACMTAGFVLIPPASRTCPIFTKTDINLDLLLVNSRLEPARLPSACDRSRSYASCPGIYAGGRLLTAYASCGLREEAIS